MNNRNLCGWSVEKMILESVLVLVLLIGGELGGGDHCSCILGSHL